MTLAELMSFATTPERKPDPVIASAVVDHAAVVFPKWGVNSHLRFWMFMAMANVESAGFTKVFEDMNYSAVRIRQVWPSRFTTNAEARLYANQPEKLANKVYGGRMGNVGPDDGWLCRGTGIMQTTGLENFEKLAKVLKVSVDECRAMLSAPATMLECAAAVFSAWGCLDFADKGNVTGCTLRLNGGLTGLQARAAGYTSAKKIWPLSRSF